jgi:hypothetical protein
MYKVSFEAIDRDGLDELVRTFARGIRSTDGDEELSSTPDAVPLAEELDSSGAGAGPEREVLMGAFLDGLRGRHNRKVTIEIAEAVTRGSVLPFEGLQARYGLETGTALAGVIGSVNRRAASLLKRYVIGWDNDRRGYTMSREDAAAILAASTSGNSV